MSYEPHNVSSPGAGFIGANFVRYWLAAAPKARSSCWMRSPTRATSNLAGLERDVASSSCAGDICDENAVRGLLERHRIDTLVHFAAESMWIARSWVRTILYAPMWSAPMLCSRPPRSCGWTESRAGASLSSRLDRRGLRIARARGPSVPRIDTLRAELTLLREQGRLGSSGARLSPHLWARYDVATAPTTTGRTISRRS